MRLPQEATKGRFYAGINAVLLLLEGFRSPFWASEDVWSGLLASVLPGQEPRCISHGAVFNLEQVNGCDHLRFTEPFEPDFGAAQDLIDKCGPRLFFGGRKPVYRIREDVIYCPHQRFFSDNAGYYASLLHELVHWTGHPKRLGRKVGWPNHSEEYALEEVVSEAGGIVLAAALGLPGDGLPEQIGYVEHYADRISEQKFMMACKLAAEAADFLLERP